MSDKKSFMYISGAKFVFSVWQKNTSFLSHPEATSSVYSLKFLPARNFRDHDAKKRCLEDLKDKIRSGTAHCFRNVTQRVETVEKTAMAHVDEGETLATVYACHKQ